MIRLAGTSLVTRHQPARDFWHCSCQLSERKRSLRRNRLGLRLCSWVVNPGQGPACCWKSERRDPKQNDVLHFFDGHSCFFRVANGGVSATFCSRSDGQGKSYEPARLLVHRTSVMTRVGQRGEALPDFGM